MINAKFLNVCFNIALCNIVKCSTEFTVNCGCNDNRNAISFNTVNIGIGECFNLLYKFFKFTATQLAGDLELGELWINAQAHNYDGENATIVNSSFSYNNAIQGGACYVEGNHSKILMSTFTNNNATRDLSNVRPDSSRITAGGAIYFIGNYVDVIDSIFTENNADGEYTNSNAEGLGGAIYIAGKNLNFDNNTFTDNTAVLGGGVFIKGENEDENISD